MSRYNKDLGDFGEHIAEKYYLKQGFSVLEKNYNGLGGEIDLIVDSESFLIFVEVKTRSSLKFGMPSEAITQKKLLHMKRAAEEYLFDHPCDKEIRFDAIEVIANMASGNPQLESINHIPGIILEGV